MENKAFTLFELVVVIFIIALLTALALPNYRLSERQLALQRSAYKLAQDLRRAQEMTMSAYFSDETGGEVPVGGYGIFVKTVGGTSLRKYVLFGDKDNNQEYESGDYTLEEVRMGIEMEKGVIILNPVQTSGGNKNNVSIVFIPPDPTVSIKPPDGADWVRVTLALESDTSVTKTIYINKAGLIVVE